MLFDAPYIALAGVPILPVLGAVLAVVVFVWAFVRPLRSITFQHRMQEWLTRSRQSAQRHAPDAAEGAAAKPIDASKGGLNKAAGAGRSLRRRMPF